MPMTVDVHELDHPLIADALRNVRSVSTPNTLFRQELGRLGLLVLAEATKFLGTIDDPVQTPLAVAPARRLATQPVLVPILRAGLGFVEAAQHLMPDADVGFVGVARDEATFQPHPYVNKLPERLDDRPCIVLDPMLATGGSLAYVLTLLAERGAPEPITVVCALAAPEGIEHLRRQSISVRVVTAAVDERLNENAYIVPGLGDAGDRQFGAPWSG